jgi:hypothetical protein
LFYGLNTVTLNNITNITYEKTGSYSNIQFSFQFSLIYNETVPTILNRSFVIEESQQKSLTRCNFKVENVTVTSIETPLEQKFIVKLYTGSRKKRAIRKNSDCSTDQTEFATLCSDSSQLTKCNQPGLNLFLDSYISRSVDFLIIYIYLKKISLNLIFRFNQFLL